jgi:hypothetical protein
MFAKKYPKDVAGIVLLDSSSPDAPGELKTRAHLEPGTAAYLEKEGIPQSNKQVVLAAPFQMSRSRSLPRPIMGHFSRNGSPP